MDETEMKIHQSLLETLTNKFRLQSNEILATFTKINT